MIFHAFLWVGVPMLLLTAFPVWGAEEQAIRFGSVAEDIPAVMHQRLTPLTDYLEAIIGRNVDLALSPNMTSAIDTLAQGKVDLAYLTPVAYVSAHAKGNVRLLAKIVTNKQAYYRLEIVVRTNSPITKVSDLAGKRFAFGDPAALLQKAAVVNAGMPLERLGSRSYLGHFDNVVRGVLNEDYDAGIVTDSKTRKWQKKGLRVIYSSPQLPAYNIAAKDKMDDALFVKLRDALLALDGRNPAHRRILDALGGDVDGFMPTSDSEYEIVRKLIKPFQQSRTERCLIEITSFV